MFLKVLSSFGTSKLLLDQYVSSIDYTFLINLMNFSRQSQTHSSLEINHISTNSELSQIFYGKYFK